MFRKLFLTAALTAAALTASPAARAQGEQTWKLGVVISSLGGGDRGCLLNQVIDGSPAQDIGLAPGDTLLTVNGQLAADPLAVRATIFASDSVVLVLKRGDGYFQKNVTFEVPGGNQANNGGGQVVTTAVASKAVKSVKTVAVAAPNLAGVKPLAHPAKPVVSPKPPVAPKPVPHPAPKTVPHPAPKTPNANR